MRICPKCGKETPKIHCPDDGEITAKIDDGEPEAEAEDAAPAPEIELDVVSGAVEHEAEAEDEPPDWERDAKTPVEELLDDEDEADDEPADWERDSTTPVQAILDAAEAADIGDDEGLDDELDDDDDVPIRLRRRRWPLVLLLLILLGAGGGAYGWRHYQRSKWPAPPSTPEQRALFKELMASRGPTLPAPPTHEEKVAAMQELAPGPAQAVVGYRAEADRHAREKRWDEAIARYRDALLLAPWDEESRTGYDHAVYERDIALGYEAANALIRQRKTKEAWDTLTGLGDTSESAQAEEIASFREELKQAYLSWLLVVVLAEARVTRYVRATEICDQALALDPDNARFKQLKANLLKLRSGIVVDVRQGVFTPAPAQ